MQIDPIREDTLTWLLEPDPANPAVRYFALRDLMNRSEREPEVRQARAEIMTSGQVPLILSAQQPEGYWVKPGAGYSPKYRGTIWQIIFLAELGADPADERVHRGCEYLLGHSRASTGAFSYSQTHTPSGAFLCLNGNLLTALLRFGYAGDARVQAALEWEAQAITGEGKVAYYQSGTSGPVFACGINLGQPCAWGAIKAIKALSLVPINQRTLTMQRAIEVGVELLFSRDPAVADYPYSGRVSSNWFQFGFPLSYWSDVLETTALLVDLGYGSDPRLEGALKFILSKQDTQGRWKLKQSLRGKMWVDIEKQGKPNKWVTLRALRVLKKVSSLR